MVPLKTTVFSSLQNNPQPYKRVCDKEELVNSSILLTILFKVLKWKLKQKMKWKMKRKMKELGRST